MVVESDRRFLIVDGEVTNSAAQTLAVPPLKVAIRGADGHVIYTWIAHAPRQKVEPGESAAFSARLASPPTYGADVVVEFDRSQERGVQGSPGGQPRASRQRS